MSIVFIDFEKGLIFIHRDIFGKRSLCLGWQEDQIWLASASFGGDMFEVPSDSLIVMTLKENRVDSLQIKVNIHH